MTFPDFERYQMAALFKLASEQLTTAIERDFFDSFQFKGDAEDAANTLYRAYNILTDYNT